MVPLCSLLGRLSLSLAAFRALTNVDFESSSYVRVLSGTFSDTVPPHTDLLDKELSSSVFLYQLKYRRGWGSLGIPVARSRGL